MDVSIRDIPSAWVKEVVRTSLTSAWLTFGSRPPYTGPMTTRAPRSIGPHPELKFWACFAVVMALLTQVFFPPQVMAAETANGPAMVLCSAGLDAAPIAADPVLAKVVKLHRSGLQGLKCANCVLASITAVIPPSPTFTPVVHSVARADFRPAARSIPVGARAPPRPFSCGPPSLA